MSFYFSALGAVSAARHSLEEINLDSNEISDRGGTALLSAVERYSSIQLLSLEKNLLSPEVGAEIFPLSSTLDLK